MIQHFGYLAEQLYIQIVFSKILYALGREQQILRANHATVLSCRFNSCCMQRPM